MLNSRAPGAGLDGLVVIATPVARIMRRFSNLKR